MNEELGRLTFKQQAFLNGLKDGKTQYQAFIDAGYSIKGKSRNYIDKEASILAKNRKISERLKKFKQEMAEEIKQKNLWSEEESIKGLMWMVSVAKKQIEQKGISTATQNAFINSIKELNAINGFNFEIQLKADQLRKEDLLETDAVIIIRGADNLED